MSDRMTEDEMEEEFRLILEVQQEIFGALEASSMISDQTEAELDDAVRVILEAQQSMLEMAQAITRRLQSRQIRSSATQIAPPPGSRLSPSPNISSLADIDNSLESIFSGLSMLNDAEQEVTLPSIRAVISNFARFNNARRISEPRAEPSLRTCAVCFVEKPLGDFLKVTNTCTHNPDVCDTCLKESLQWQLTGATCNSIRRLSMFCDQPLEYTDMLRVATTETFQR